MKISVLLVDDDIEVVEEISELLKFHSCNSSVANNGKEGLEKARTNAFDIIITDLQMPIMDGFEFISEVRKFNNDIPILVMSGHNSIEYAIKAIKVGADDFIIKPVTANTISFYLEKTIERKSNEKFAKDYKEYIKDIEKTHSFDGIISIDKTMQNIFEQIKMVANLDITVMITGESGCGKELVARSIHKRSKRVKGPFVPINSGSLPRELVASELFGHIKGSFTGAYTSKIGKFEEAKDGTLFLDELLTMDENTQISLLRVLETGEFYKIGGNTAIKADVRIITATNADVEKAIEENKFREDLFHRLNVFSIKLPPLRERKDDIEILIKHFSKIFSKELQLPEAKFEDETIDIMKKYKWTGNIRELRNVVQRAMILSSGNNINTIHLPENIIKNKDITKTTSIRKASENSVNDSKKEIKENEKIKANNLNSINDLKIEISLDLTFDEIEKQVIEAQLKRCYGNKKVVAEKLGISRKSLYTKISKYNISDVKS